MSVECRIVVGVTIELFETELSHTDYDRIEDFLKQHPKLDEYNYHFMERTGKPLLIYDGMNGDFARLVWPDKIIEPGMLGEGNEFIESYIPSPMSDPDIGTKITTLTELYEEFTGEPCGRERVKYAMWSQWF